MHDDQGQVESFRVLTGQLGATDIGCHNDRIAELLIAKLLGQNGHG